MIFWLVAAVMTAGALAIVLVPLALRHRRAPKRVEFDLAIYRDQLHELESDRVRGLIGEEQSEAARLEIQRRMLAASKRGEGAAANEAGDIEAEAETSRLGGNMRWFAIGGIGAAIPALAIALYFVIGSPGTPGQPFTGVAQLGGGAGATGGQEMAGQSIDDAILGLAQRLEQNPNNLEGWLLLGRSLITLERYSEAAQALSAAVTLSNGDPDIIGSMAEAMVFADDGAVTAEALAAFETVLGVKPDDPAAQYYIGMAMAQQGRPAEALGMWQKLAAETPADAPWRTDLVTLMRRAASETGIELGSIPSAPASAGTEASADDVAPGPSAEDMAAAAEMSPEERMEMIRGMVARLATRLETEPDDLAGWRRLANAYRVLGEDAKAAEAEARVTEHEAGGRQQAGPSQEHMAAAAEMSPEDRMEMIRSMVDRLAARLEEEPDNLDGWRQLARSYRVLGEDAKAAEAEKRIAELEAGGASSPADSAAASDPESMIASLVAAVRENPGDVQRWLRLGRAFSMLDRHGDARDAYAWAAQLAPEDATILSFHARAVMNAAGDAQQFPERAIRIYRRILALDADFPEALWFMGFAEAGRGRSNEARGYWTTLRDLLPEGSADRQAVERALGELQEEE